MVDRWTVSKFSRYLLQLNLIVAREYSDHLWAAEKSIFKTRMGSYCLCTSSLKTTKPYLFHTPLRKTSRPQRRKRAWLGDT